MKVESQSSRAIMKALRQLFQHSFLLFCQKDSHSAEMVKFTFFKEHKKCICICLGF